MTKEELLKVAKPILFNTEMVKAILDGRKIVTRRVINRDIVNRCDMERDGTLLCFEDAYGDHIRPEKLCRYKPGDILYVRETWCWCPCWDCGMDTEEHNCCYEGASKFFNHEKGEYGCYGYRASFEDNEYPSVDTWHPSIHMPKEAARIFLQVKDVRVERLQDITEQQAQLEGCNSGMLTGPCTARGQFERLWNSTVDKKQINTYGWDANPYVWVIEFERIEVE